MTEKILRIGPVKDRTGLSAPTIYRLIRQGDFPSQLRLGPQCVGWRASDIDRWIEERPQVAASGAA